MNANLREPERTNATGASATGGWALAALESHPDAHTVLEVDGRIAWMNSAAARLLGCRPADAIGQQLHKLKPVYAERLDLARLEVPANHTWLYPDGRVGHFCAKLARLTDGRVLLVESDVGSGLRLELDQVRQERLRELAAMSQDTVLAIGPRGEILAHSASFGDLLGQPGKRFEGQYILDHVHPADLTLERERFASGAMVYAPRRFTDAKCRLRHERDGWRWVAVVMLNAFVVPSLEAAIVYVRDAGDTVALEQQLRRRERRYAALTEHVKDMIAVLGCDGNFQFEGKSFPLLLGQDHATLQGRRLLHLLHPAHRRNVVSTYRELRSQPGRQRTLELLLRARDGTYRWIEAVCVNLNDEPDIEGILITARDITVRKGAELERDVAVVCGEIALWDYDVGTRRGKWIGRGMPEVFDSQEGAYLEDDYYPSIHPDDLPAVQRAYAQVDQRFGSTIQVKFRTRDRQGNWRWILERSQVAGINPQTGAPRLAGVSIDITDQRQTQEQLAEARSHLRFALDSVQIGCYDWDIESDVATGIDDWCARYGLPREGRPGHDVRWTSYIHPDDRADVQRRFDAHLRDETDFADLEYRLRTGNGRTMWVMDRSRVVARAPDGSPRRVIGLVVDIDARKRVEQALLASEARLATAIWGGSFGLWEMDVASQRTRWLSDWCEREDFDPCEEDHVASWDSHIHPDDAQAAIAAFSRMSNNETDAFECEYRVRTRSGRWKWILERSRAVERRPDGKPSKIAGICINIDATKSAAIELRISESRYRSVANLTPGFVCELRILDDGAVQPVWISDGFSEVIGAPADAYLDLARWRALLPDESVMADLLAAFGRLRLGRSHQVDLEIRRTDGRPRWLQLTVKPLPGESGRFRSAIAVAYDITARKLAELALRKAQQDLQTIAANSPDWMFLLDPDLRIRYVTRSVNGITASELIGRSILDPLIAAPGDVATLANLLARTMVGEEGAMLPTFVDKRTSKVRHLMHRTRPVFEGGQPVGVVITSTDVTEAREREELLRLQARVLETIREGVVLIDHDRRIQLTNPAFDRMCGCDASQLLGRRIEELWLLEPERLLPDTLLEGQVRRLDGSQFTAAAAVTPMHVKGEPHLLLVLSDISERKLLEREILEVSVHEQQRIGIDLHDGLGQELTGVALMLRALAKRLELEYPYATNEIGEIVTLVNHSIESTRALARGLSPVSVERGGLLQALQTLIMRARSAYGIAINTRRQLHRPLQLDADTGTHLYRIVQEALTNAVRHGRATHVSITITSDAGHVTIAIRDNGRGFVPGREQRGGIGLKTMRYRAQMLQGELSIEPARGGGTIVRCRCPQIRDADRAASAINETTLIS